MKEIDVSVIMPVHNGEAYIEETLRCLMRQTLQRIEILVVDDDSNDRTAEQVKRLQEEDGRIHYIRQEKSNAGVARNRGFADASGKAVLFLDADDLFEDDLLETLYRSLTEQRADICVCDADQYDTKTGSYIAKPQYLRKQYLPETSCFSKTEIGKHILYFTTSVPWNKMISAEFLRENKIVFQDIERANDQYFSVLCLLSAGRICTVDRVLVHYRINQQGNLTTEFSDTPLCAYQAMETVRDELERRGLLADPDVRCAFDNKALNLMIYSLNIQRSVDAYKLLYETLTNGGFEKLGMTLREEDYYFNAMEYQNFVHFQTLSYDQFLLLKNREYRDVIARKNQNYKDMTRQRDEAKKQLRETEKELQGILKKKWYQKMIRMIAVYHRLIGKGE